MGIFGAHLGVSEGYLKMFETASQIDCEAVQIFAKNQRRWESNPLNSDDIKIFKSAFKNHKMKYADIHGSYLLNFAASDEMILNKSVSNMIDDLNRGRSLGIDDIVMHPGAHMGIGEDAGIKRVCSAVNTVISNTDSGNVVIETTSGQGTVLGYRFEHLRDIISGIKNKKRVFVCYDTCHTFSAGYDIRSEESYEKTFEEFEKIVGIDKIRVFHVNDSMTELASRKDRHQFIGLGFIGVNGFKNLVNDKRFVKLPMILEVPGEAEEFGRGIKLLKSFIKT